MTWKTALLAMSLLAVGCAGSQEKDPPPPTIQQQETARSAGERDLYVQQTTERLDRYREFTNMLRTRASQQPKSLSRDMVQSANRMQTMMGDARRELEALRAAPATNWAAQRVDVEREMLRAESQYNEAVKMVR